jgi:molecular chaperone GrpE
MNKENMAKEEKVKPEDLDEIETEGQNDEKGKSGQANEALAQEASIEVLQVAEEEVEDEIADLRKELEEIRQKSAEYLDGWQRARAEFANFKKRMERERQQAHQTAAGSIIRRYLEIVDDLERALKNKPTNGEGAEWAGGIELIYRKLISILEAEGVTSIEPQGQLFDPNLHEAISHEENPDHESGEIIEVVQSGYMLDGRVLRPARVRVAK